MKKKISLLLFTSLLAFSSEYITLDNGKSVLLKDDGTWEEVTIVKKGDKNIALRKDGKWEEIKPKDIEAAQTITNETSKKYMDSKFAKALLGEWQSNDGSVKYLFKKDKAVFKKGSRIVEGKWSIEHIDEPKRKIIVNIGEDARLGFLSFGGVSRKLKFSPDFKTLYDESEKLESLIDTELHKVK
ncbi:DUF3157 family protein [Nitrosophilus labii]|uniref:DUF3157 family protein n=1 Tax=Nitrosophilus labii TaxID=2706014 RepID=UPI0016573885|nr:DUF3157 family protein [Nitrosophilus labii]